MKTVKNILDKVTSYASVFIFIMMVLMVTYQVVARYIFSAPSSVTEILTRYSFVWLISMLPWISENIVALEY